MKFLDWMVYNNSVKTWIIAVLIFLVSLVAFKIIKKFVIRKLGVLAKRTKSSADDIILLFLEKTTFLMLVFMAIFLGSLVLSLPLTTRHIIQSIVIIVLLFQVAVWGNALISFGLDLYKKKSTEKDPSEATTMVAIAFVGRLILYSIIILLSLDNLGINITALITGLGIGGIAVALAVQNVLSDLFASLSIVLDKPFVLGDFIIIDNYLGTVEHIGLKTTRVRSLSGEQLIFANNDLLKSRIRNYKRMYERRVVFSIGVTYNTPYEKLAAIPGMIREIVESKEQVRFDRAHFKSYGDYSLNFETVYWVKNPDYNVYMDIHQAINLEIFRKFTKEGIEFAFPTQTVYLEKENQTDQNKQE
ncbi:MAG: mechanosensitive ion channel family protein [Calditrichaeota bacterium]|nr:mechanosensitive ion channel family protein [Calditrichota bacterium]